MDFGDILKRWENKKDGEPKKSVMDKWLNENTIIDKDAQAEFSDSQKHSIPGEKRRRLLNQKPDDVVDIHGLTSEQAWLKLEQVFEAAKRNGYKKIRIIHGKGNHSQTNGVLKHIVRKFIEGCGYAGESGFEKAANGGTGATWILLKSDHS
ncbi:MAG: Smr/MutS family protein [Treponema sp.]|nr:Smr/MutS family protein [Treponema sp.]